MRKSNWTPSIVGRDDQDAYLVVDPGRLGRVWCEADVEATDFETVVMDLLDGQYKNPIGILPSTPPKAGRGTSRKMSPWNCASAVICNYATCRPQFRISSSGMKVHPVN
jgi:hypothetical protein